MAGMFRFRRGFCMHRDLKLHFLKQLVNWPVRVLDRFLTFPREAEFPQTKMLLHAYASMVKMYGYDVAAGSFTEKNGLPDGNFERLLRVSVKVLARVSEDDRYYRAWLGFIFILAESEYERFVSKVTPDELRKFCQRQWLYDLRLIPDAVLLESKRDFAEVVLCDYLGNLARLDTNLFGIPGKTSLKKGGKKIK